MSECVCVCGGGGQRIGTVYIGGMFTEGVSDGIARLIVVTCFGNTLLTRKMNIL